MKRKSVTDDLRSAAIVGLATAGALFFLRLGRRLERSLTPTTKATSKADDRNGSSSHVDDRSNESN